MVASSVLLATALAGANPLRNPSATHGPPCTNPQMREPAAAQGPLFSSFLTVQKAARLPASAPARPLAHSPLEFQCTCPAEGSCHLSAQTPSCPSGQWRSAEVMVPERLPGTDVTAATVAMGVPVWVAACPHSSTPTAPSPTLPGR